MNWTTEAPKVDGWYWVQPENKHDLPEIVKITGDSFESAGYHGTDKVARILHGCVFLGPLDPSQLLSYESLVKELHLTRLALGEAAPQGECQWHYLGEGWYRAECRPAEDEEWSYNGDWKVCPYCAKRIKSVP